MILVIDKSQKNASLISEIFYNMGLLSLAITPERAAYEISNRYRAVLITSPEALGSAEEFISMLKRFSLSAPVFALYRDKARFDIACLDERYFDKIFYGSEISYGLISEMIEYQRQNGMRVIGSYRILGLDASVFIEKPTFFDVPVSLTKTETMIIRFLAVAFPAPVKATDILKFAFKSSRCPEVSNIRTHISSINKKLFSYLQRPFISSESGIGYTVNTPPESCVFNKEPIAN